MEIDERTTSIEDVKRLLLSGRHISKKDLERENYINSSCLSQRIYDLRHLAKYGCLDWDIKWRSVPGKGTLREFWLEPEEIARIKVASVCNVPLKAMEQDKEMNEQIEKNIENLRETAQKVAQNEKYEQIGLGLLGGHNY